MGWQKKHGPATLVEHLMFSALSSFRGKRSEYCMVLLFDQSKFYDRIEANLLPRKMKDIAVPKNILIQVRHILT